MPSRTKASNSESRRQQRLDVTSQEARVGSDSDSSDSEIELEDPVVTADRQAQQSQRLDEYVRSEGPWSVYNQRRQSEATARDVMAEQLRAFDQKYRRSTTP